MSVKETTEGPDKVLGQKMWLSQSSTCAPSPAVSSTLGLQTLCLFPMDRPQETGSSIHHGTKSKLSTCMLSTYLP